VPPRADGLHARADDRVRRRRERRRPRRVGRLRDRGRERARARQGGGGLDLSTGRRRGRRRRDRGVSRLTGMIDLRPARPDPESFRAALARKGAAGAFDALLAADERWRGLVPEVDDLRARRKLDGKPTPEQLEGLARVKEELRVREEELAAAAAERDEL